MNLPKELGGRALTAAAALLVFLVVSVLYFAPQFRGETLPQHDVIQYEGMARDITEMRLATGEDPQWTGGMFGGMPAYLINVAYPAQLVRRTVGQATKILDTPASFLFFAMTAFWAMLLMMGIDPRPAIVPALAYGLSTYFLLIIGAGHLTKMWALVYAPLMMGGAWITLRRNMWYGGALTALAASLEIGSNHPQIAYYFLLAMGALWISDAVIAFREKHLRNFAQRTAVLLGAGLLAVASNFAPLWYTATHTEDTIRGGSELAEATEKTTGGLDLDYATAWSYGKAETFNLLIPDFMGRDSGTVFPADGEVAATATDLGMRGIERQLPMYWGTQPYTGGPVYVGAAVIFLALLGFLLARGRNKWWIAAVSLLMILLSWGRNFMDFTELAFRLLPGYNKFRTVSMTLVVVQWAAPLLGAFALVRLWNDDVDRQRLLHSIAWAAGITGGLCLLFAVAGGVLFDFGERDAAAMMTESYRRILEANDLQNYIDRGIHFEWADRTAAAMAADRAAFMQADAWRSLLMVLLAAGSVVLFALRKIGRKTAALLLAATVLLDLVPVDLRFLSHDNFVSPRRQQVTMTAADRAIRADETLGYRVINLTVSPFNDATTSYFHRSVGGYHGAKLVRYQDLIDRYLSELDDNVLDMLNTRYAIVAGADGAPVPVRRGTEYGAAWLVDTLRCLPDARAEIEALGTVDLRTTAVASPLKSGSMSLNSAPAGPYATGEIELVEYKPNYLKYTAKTEGEAFAVFSEIYYDKGWKAYIDGEEAPYRRVDYVLRGMVLPAGEHTIEWRFRAPGWNWTEGITLAASLLILLGALAALAHLLRKYLRENEG